MDSIREKQMIPAETFCMTEITTCFFIALLFCFQRFFRT
jgi:hypothetical protein